MASTVTRKGISEFGKCHVVEVLAEDADSWKVMFVTSVLANIYIILKTSQI